MNSHMHTTYTYGTKSQRMLLENMARIDSQNLKLRQIGTNRELSLIRTLNDHWNFEPYTGRHHR